MLESRGQNQRWPTSGVCGYITPAAWQIPYASERGTQSEVAHKWGVWLHNPCRLADPLRFRAGHTITGGPQVGRAALPPAGSRMLQSGGQNQRWPTSGPGGYITRVAWGVPNASQRGPQSVVAHKWAGWLHVLVHGTLSEGGNSWLLYTSCGGVGCHGFVKTTRFTLREESSRGKTSYKQRGGKGLGPMEERRKTHVPRWTRGRATHLSAQHLPSERET